MIRHIVMWKFKEGEEARKQQFFAGLRGLYGVIPELKYMELAENIGGSSNYDAVLVSDFESLEALQTYKDDPRHKAVSALCKSIRIDRTCVDYEL